MAQNKKYSASLQKVRMQVTNAPDVDPALNSYIVMLLRSSPVNAIDAKEQPVVKLSIIIERLQQLSAMGDKHIRILHALLRRVCMNGYIPSSALVPLLDTLHNQEGNSKLVRAVLCLVGITVGCGSAGSPVPLLPAAGTTYTPLVLAVEPFDAYSQSWSVLGDIDALPTQRARLALRLLGSAARCALTALPTSDDNDAVAAQLVQDAKAAVGIVLAEEFPEEELTSKDAAAAAAGLRRAQAAALLLARVALPRGDLTALRPDAVRVVTTASPLGVRHALAVLCRIPSAKLKGSLGPLVPALAAAFEAYASDGLLHEDPPPPPGQPPPPGVLPLGDWLARIYLARLMAKLIFSGGVTGGTKALLWKILSRLAFSARERPQVRLEVWKALFGEVLPQPLALFPPGDPTHTALPPSPFNDATEHQLAAFKAAAWRATSAALVPRAAKGRRRKGPGPALAAGPEGAAADQFQWLVQQLLRMLQSPNAATVCGGARALRAMAEARAHTAHADGDTYDEDPRISNLFQAQVVPALKLGFEGTHAPAVQLHLLEALLWLHLPSQPTITPELMRAAVHSSAVVSTPVPGYAPWPPSDVGAVVQAVDRRILAAPELTGALLTAVSAMAAGAPSSMLPTTLLRLWTRAMALEMDTGVHNGARDAALQAAVDLLSAGPPTMCMPGPAATPYELAVGMKESHAWARLKDMAAAWLGDHANHATDELVWYPPPPVERKAPSVGEKGTFGEPEMLALLSMRNPRLLAVIAQLQRVALAAPWPLRVTAAHALAKVAVKSGEPFRFHCFSILRGLAGGGGGEGTNTSDALGLASVVAPLVRVLNSMYAGQIVMKQHADAYGLDWSRWHGDVFESVQRRHEALLADVEQYIAPNVPEGAFFPLGIKSQVLLTGEAAVVDPEALAEVKEHAVAKAEAAWAAAQRAKEAELAGRALLEEEEAAGAGEDAEAAASESASSDVPLETISFAGDDIADRPDLGAELDRDAGFARPDFDPFDPDAWAAQEPGLFEGVGGSPAPAAADSDAGSPGGAARTPSGPLHTRRLSGISARLSGTPRAGASQAQSARLDASPVVQQAALDAGSDSSGEITAADRRALHLDMAAAPSAQAAPHAPPPWQPPLGEQSSFLVEEYSMPISQVGGDTGVLAAAAPPSAAAGPTLRNDGGVDGAAGGGPDWDEAEDGDLAPLAAITYDFDAVEEGEMTVRAGDRVYLLQILDGGWAYVQNSETGEVGNVPEWAVEDAGAGAGAEEGAYGEQLGDLLGGEEGARDNPFGAIASEPAERVAEADVADEASGGEDEQVAPISTLASFPVTAIAEDPHEQEEAEEAADGSGEAGRGESDGEGRAGIGSADTARRTLPDFPVAADNPFRLTGDGTSSGAGDADPSDNTFDAPAQGSPHADVPASRPAGDGGDHVGGLSASAGAFPVTASASAMESLAGEPSRGPDNVDSVERPMMDNPFAGFEDFVAEQAGPRPAGPQ